MAGGPSDQQKQAAASQSALADTMRDLGGKQFALQQDAYHQIKPYATSRIQNGLPFFKDITDFKGGATARAYAPAEAAIKRRYATMPGAGGNSGAEQQALSDLEATKARSYDDNILSSLFANEDAKRQGAGVLTGQQQIANPQSYLTGASQGYSSIANNPNLRSGGIGGVLGGILQGGMQAATAFA
jgi:hypothetical protein